MANVQFGGLISGLDVYALILGLVKAESRTVDVFKALRRLATRPRSPGNERRSLSEVLNACNH
jgi:hypothetical protein